MPAATNESLPRVSILMPTYNHAKFIAQAIEGVLSQQVDFTYELLLGDDFSTDGTREICVRYAQKHPDKIVLFASDRNLGAMANGRQLHAAVRGEFLAICEGDDHWTSPFKLQKQVQALDAHPNWSGCFHKTRVIHDDQSVPDEFLPRTNPSGEVDLKEIVIGNCIATCSIMYRRELVPAVPDWLYELALGDWPLHILHAVHGPLGYLEDEMAVYHVHSTGMWSTLKQTVQVDHSLKALFALETHIEEPARSVIVSGRREFLNRLCIQHIADLKSEIARLSKIEFRYRALQLHRLAAVGKWFKQFVGR